MSYKYKEVGEKPVVWIRLIKPYNSWMKTRFPEDLKVGDITWVAFRNSNHYHHYHIEDNRYSGNFDGSYFEILEEKPLLELTNNYEIY